MAAPSTIGPIRFGYGLGPSSLPRPPESLTEGLQQPDQMARIHKGTSLRQGLKLAKVFREAGKAARNDEPGGQAAYRAARRDLQDIYRATLATGLARIVDSQTPLRERLVWFWADHFTAAAKRAPLRGLASAYLDEAIRPNITGTFADLLKAVVTHPFMLNYLDQVASVGPNSTVGKRRNRGLNENLAREVLELHTLGVNASYSQNDVRGLAELMTGLSVDPGKGFLFRNAIAEPGTKTVLGKAYGGRRGKLDDVLAAMDDLSVHPNTASHIAEKLARHFVSEDPDPRLVFDLEKAFTASNGDLMTVYEVLLAHPSATSELGRKAKQPFDFVASSLVALGYSGKEVSTMTLNDARKYIHEPMVAMGQEFLAPPGPDGWSESAEDWITPQGLATRITWAMAVAEEVQARVGDPRDFLDRTLEDAASRTLQLSVAGAPTRAEGIGLVLASAEFNRR